MRTLAINIHSTLDIVEGRMSKKGASTEEFTEMQSRAAHTEAVKTGAV